MASKKVRVREARQHLEKAREQLGQAQTHAWEPAEPAECITKCFYGFENALTAATTVVGKRMTTKHYEKVTFARELVAEGRLQTDIGDRLVELNDLRKDVQYGVPGAALIETDLEEVLTELEEYLEEVETLIAEVEES